MEFLIILSFNWNITKIYFYKIEIEKGIIYTRSILFCKKKSLFMGFNQRKNFTIFWWSNFYHICKRWYIFDMYKNMILYNWKLWIKKRWRIGNIHSTFLLYIMICKRIRRNIGSISCREIVASSFFSFW